MLIDPFLKRFQSVPEGRQQAPGPSRHPDLSAEPAWDIHENDLLQEDHSLPRVLVTPPWANIIFLLGYQPSTAMLNHQGVFNPASLRSLIFWLQCEVCYRTLENTFENATLCRGHDRTNNPCNIPSKCIGWNWCSWPVHDGCSLVFPYEVHVNKQPAAHAYPTQLCILRTLPTLTTVDRQWNRLKQRWLLGIEKLANMGFPVNQAIASAYGVELRIASSSFLCSLKKSKPLNVLGFGKIAPWNINMSPPKGAISKGK